jgi:hypothetical protein
MSLGGTVVSDTLAVPLNIVAKTDVGFFLHLVITCRAVGGTGNLLTQGTLTTRAIVGAAAAGVEGVGVEIVPYNAAPAVGANFNTSSDLEFDFSFTQTVATGSQTLHGLQVYALNERT